MTANSARPHPFLVAWLGEDVGQPTQTSANVKRGLGLSGRGHVLLVVSYGAVLLLVAGFGAGRLRESVPVFWGMLSARQHNIAAIRTTQAAFQAAIRADAAMPKPNPVVPHRIAAYPGLAVRRHEEGDVILKVLVLPSGQVGDVAVLQSSGFPQLDAAALTGVGDWYYVPAARSHQPVPAWTRVKVHFALASDSPDPATPAPGSAGP